MDWSKIKSMFLISFLILNLYLVYQISVKVGGSELSSLTEATIEEQLLADDITYTVELPKQTPVESYVSGERHKFTEEEVEAISDSKVQIASNASQYKLTSTLMNPISIKEKSNVEMLNQFVSQHIYKGELYKFWGIDEDKKQITFYQVYYDKQIYANPNAMIVFHYDDMNQIYLYEQTYLEGLSNIVPKEERKQVIAPIRAIEVIYSKNLLQSGSKITNVELGYYSLVHMQEGVQVIVPTWNIQIDGTKNYFVNAIEGQVFLEETQWSE